MIVTVILTPAVTCKTRKSHESGGGSPLWSLKN